MSQRAYYRQLAADGMSDPEHLRDNTPDSPTRYVCTIPSLPPSLNEWSRMHWAQRRLLRDDFQRELWAVLNEKGNRCPRGLERIEVRAVLTFGKKRRRDSDNFGAVLAKWTQDVLVREGVIPDDTADRCTFYPPGIVIGEEEGTLIVVEIQAEGRRDGVG